MLPHAASGLHTQAIFGFDGQGVPSLPKLDWKLRQLCVLRRIGMYGVVEGRSTTIWDASVLSCRLGSFVSVEYVWFGSFLCMLEQAAQALNAEYIINTCSHMYIRVWEVSIERRCPLTHIYLYFLIAGTNNCSTML